MDVHIPSGYSMSTIWAFHDIENKHTLYREKDCRKKFRSSFRRHAKNIIDFKKRNMLPLRTIKIISNICYTSNICYICGKRILKKSC